MDKQVACFQAAGWWVLTNAVGEGAEQDEGSLTVRLVGALSALVQPGQQGRPLPGRHGCARYSGHRSGSCAAHAGNRLCCQHLLQPALQHVCILLQQRGTATYLMCHFYKVILVHNRSMQTLETLSCSCGRHQFEKTVQHCKCRHDCKR